MPDSIDPERFDEVLANDNVQVVDVRSEPDELVDGAVALPYDDLTDNIDDIEWADEIVVVCRRGRTASSAARLLEAADAVPSSARVAVLDGGLESWRGE